MNCRTALAALMAVLVLVPSGLAQTAPSVPLGGTPARKPDALPLLTGRPDALSKDDLRSSGMYQNPLAGIAFRTPAGLREVKGQGEEIARFVNQDQRWELVVTRATSAQPLPLTGAAPGAHAAPTVPRPSKNGEDGVGVGAAATQSSEPLQFGLLETLAARLKQSNPGVEIVRQDTVNLGEFSAGIIAARVSARGGPKLLQQAMVQANDQLYYVLTMTSPAAEDAKGADSADAGEIAAVDAFSTVLDSVELLDRTAVKDDQNERLFRTRSLFVNLTSARVRQALIHEQWMRLVQNGKDVGYTYIVEEPDDAAGQNGVKIGIRSRSYPNDDTQVDGETWYFVSGDRNHENWSNLLWVQNKAKKTSEQITEFGSSDRAIKRVLVGTPPFRPDENPPVQEVEVYTLNVQTLGNAPLKQELPPWYLPQALSHLLPRLLSLREPKSYMFAVYVGDEGKVMHRYVEVGTEQIAELDGQQVRAVPITDRIRLEGVPTIHYMGPDGKYLGSVNKESGIMILPTDAQTLQAKWANADLSRPKEVDRPAGGAGAEETTAPETTVPHTPAAPRVSPTNPPARPAAPSAR